LYFQNKSTIIKKVFCPSLLLLLVAVVVGDMMLTGGLLIEDDRRHGPSSRLSEHR